MSKTKRKPNPPIYEETIGAIEILAEKADNGEIAGIAYVVIMADGGVAHGYTDECSDQPEYTTGLLHRLILTLLRKPSPHMERPPEPEPPKT